MQKVAEYFNYIFIGLYFTVAAIVGIPLAVVLAPFWLIGKVAEYALKPKKV